MKFELRDPRTITPSPWNSNVVSHENEEKLRASIERNGMFKPILVRELDDGDLQCIGGWHRCEQAIELGMQEVPVVNLGPISEEKAKEISLADNARYGIDDTFRLSEILSDLDTSAMEAIMPWTKRDIDAITATLATSIEDLDMDEPIIPDPEDEDEPAPTPKAPKTHTVLRFRCSLQDAAKISALVNEVMKREGFTKEDDLSNAGDALSFMLLKSEDDAE